jgi:hypothetical protein
MGQLAYVARLLREGRRISDALEMPYYSASATSGSTEPSPPREKKPT